VAAVGYGTNEEGKEYVIVKNSFGTDWGEDGYMRIAIGADGN
jgi:cathepsin L